MFIIYVYLKYHDPDDEPSADPIPESFFDFDKHKDQLSKEQLKRTYLLFFVCFFLRKKVIYL